MKTLLKNLKTATFNVLEKMFFILPDTDDELGDIRLQGDDTATIYIGITGSPSYLISMVFEKTMVANMAHDLLGIDCVDESDDLIEKCLSETANIIAGRFLLMFDETENRNISLPSIRREDVFGNKSSSESGEKIVSFDGYPVQLKIDVIL